jgi:peptide/nickel transport system substrate-binding protein
MNVELATMDWQSVVARRAKMEPIGQGGWHIFHTFAGLADMSSPLSNVGIDSRGKSGWFGWADVPEIERLRDLFARETDPAKQKVIAEDVQKLAYSQVTFVPLGQFTQPSAHRKSVVDIVAGPAHVFWGLKKRAQ